MATIATGKKKYQQGFDPIPGGFIQARFNDLEDVKRHVNDELAAIVIEPIQGEGGYIVPPDSFIPGLRRLCDKHSILLIADEVVTAFGRLGSWFASRDIFDYEPDMLVSAKGITSGYIPLGATLISDEIYEVISRPQTGRPGGWDWIAIGVSSLPLLWIALRLFTS